MIECVKCGAESMPVVSSQGSKVNLRCTCGHEAWVLADYETDWPNGPLPSNEPCFHLNGCWTGKPSVKQVVGVLALFPGLKEAGFSALWRKAIAHENIYFGSNIQEQVDNMARELHGLGVETRQALDGMTVPAELG
jgi:hypothetical protein